MRQPHVSQFSAIKYMIKIIFIIILSFYDYFIALYFITQIKS